MQSHCARPALPGVFEGFTVQNFALIDLNSGFVWWVGQADSAADACMRADADIDQPRGEYHAVTRSEINSTAGGYSVKLAPAGFDVQDGQNAAEIAAVDALPLAGFYRLAAH